MTSRPRKLISPKRVEILIDEPIYHFMVKRLDGHMSISEYIRHLIARELSEDFERRMDDDEWRPPTERGS